MTQFNAQNASQQWANKKKTPRDDSYEKRGGPSDPGSPKGGPSNPKNPKGNGPKKPPPTQGGAAAEIPKTKEKSPAVLKSEPRYRTSAR